MARNGRYRRSSASITAGNAPNSSSTVRKVSNSPSIAKKASGSATRRTTEQKTSPSFHWAPASSAPIEAYPRRITVRPLTRSQEREFILWGIAEEPTWPSLNPSVTSSLPAIRRIVVARLDGPAATWTSAESTSWSSERG